MRTHILILFIILLGACTKPVDTIYFKKEDLTRFKTKPFKSEKKNKEIRLVAEKECPGKLICTNVEIKLSLTHEGRFTFLRGKNLDLETDQGKIDLNQRDYSYSYNSIKKSKAGTSGVLTEKFLIWISEPDFIKAAKAESATMYIGDYAFELSNEGRNAWKIMMDKDLLLGIMDEEQQREYGKYPHENKKNKELNLRKKRILSEAAESTWKMIENSDNREDFRYFLEQFPDSPYAIPAKLKLNKLERENY
tara:strand:+ start:175 stop:924 length:750 start_codon:yes stop_codon:yes gene_type:complete